MTEQICVTDHYLHAVVRVEARAIDYVDNDAFNCTLSYFVFKLFDRNNVYMWRRPGGGACRDTF